MKTVIEKYKKFIFVVITINCFALLVNVFHISINSDINSGEIFYFTSNNFTTNSTPEGFWPFVQYSRVLNKGYSSELYVFNGIFYQYGVAEFLLYMGILIGFLIYKAYIATPFKVKVPGV